MESTHQPCEEEAHNVPHLQMEKSRLRQVKTCWESWDLNLCLSEPELLITTWFCFYPSCARLWVPSTVGDPERSPFRYWWQLKSSLSHSCRVGCRAGTHTWLGSLCLLVGGPPPACRLIWEGGITRVPPLLLLRQVRTNSPSDTWKIKEKKVTIQVSFTQRGDNIKTSEAQETLGDLLFC